MESTTFDSIDASCALYIHKVIRRTFGKVKRTTRDLYSRIAIFSPENIIFAIYFNSNLTVHNVKVNSFGGTDILKCYF